MNVSSSFVPVSWTGLGPDLSIALDRHAGRPLRAQLENELRQAIQDGRLEPGERMPSSRVLADQLGISRRLVTDCYEQLVSEGYLVSHPGAATIVSPGVQRVSPAPRPRADMSEYEFNFRPFVPDPASFPRADWLWAAGQASRGLPSARLGYEDEARGLVDLREVIAAYVRRVRGAVAQPDNVVVTAGFTQAIGLVLRALNEQGIRTVAVEDPGSTYRQDVAGRIGMTCVPIPVDDDGLDVTALASSGVSVVVVTPAHQSPTGAVMSAERRHALIDWAKRTDGLVIEDDYDAEFRYDKSPIGTLQGLAPERVVLLGSVSKSLAPGLRIGWVVCPSHLVDPVADGKYFDDGGSPVLDHLILAELLRSGRFDRHLRRMRQVYGARRSVLLEALEDVGPAVSVTGAAAGLHLVLNLPAGVSEQNVIEEAARWSVGLRGMSRFWLESGSDRPAQLVLGFGLLSERGIREGIRRVSDVLTSY